MKSLARFYLDTGMWLVCVLTVVVGYKTDGLTYWAPMMGLQAILGFAALYYAHFKKP